LEVTSKTLSATEVLDVREDLRRVHARVAYDIRKLSELAGDDGLEEMVEYDKSTPFYTQMLILRKWNRMS
jgi:hypothetical protein